MGQAHLSQRERPAHGWDGKAAPRSRRNRQDNMRVEAAMTILSLLILLAIICAYSWVAYKVKTTVPKVDVTVPSSVKLIPFRIEDCLDSPEAAAEYARQEADDLRMSGDRK